MLCSLFCSGYFLRLPLHNGGAGNRNCGNGHFLTRSFRYLGTGPDSVMVGRSEKWNFEGTYVVSSYIEKEMWKP